MLYNFIGVKYVTRINQKLEVEAFESKDNIARFLSKPENLGHQWVFYPIGEELVYNQEIAVTVK